MGKDKKNKKLKREESDDEDVSRHLEELSIKDPSSLKTNQNMVSEESTLTSKKSKNKKNKAVSFDDETASKQNHNDTSFKSSKNKPASENIKEVTSKSKKRDKKKPLDSETDEDEPLPAVNIARPKAGFAMLATFNDESESLPPSSEDEEPINKVKEQKPEPSVEQPPKKEEKAGKKSKKKERKKKKDDDDEEIDKLLEELALESKGIKPTPSEKNEEKHEVENKSTKPSKDKEVIKSLEESKQVEEKADDKTEAIEQEGSTVKTAAQKRKEKKERERQKKLAQHAQEKTKQKEHKTEDTVDKPFGDISKNDAEAGEEEENEPQKKKDKKKKSSEEEKKDKKKPGKKQLEKMQEHLKKMKEEEERLKREEEERQRALEEAERLRQEQLRLEQERKERKKQKEKERKERLKAEGKLLSKAEKQKRERAQATLASLKAQGIEVPEIGEKRDRKPRYDKKRGKKKSEENVEAPAEKEIKPELEPSPPVEKSEPIQVEVTVETEKPSEIEEETEDVKDAWDASSSDEEENSHESPLSTNEVKAEDKSVESGDDSDDENEDSESETSSEEDSSQDESSKKQTDKKIALQRIQKHREEAEKKRDINKLRSPIICVLGHVDTGKTKILDKIRHTNVQDCEAGGITQQIGATMVPRDAIMEQCKMAKSFSNLELKIPGLLIIDTPGHESFSNLRSRGSSQCDIAILVVDIMHGLEPQTIESINILKKRRTPFVVALNKIDRLYDWKKAPHRDIQEVLKGMSRITKSDFEQRTKNVQLQFSEQGLNTALYYENPDVKSYVSLVPTSAITGDGMGNLMTLIIEYSQSLLAKKLAFSEELQATVLEVKAIPGLGTTIDVILINGRLKEGDTIIVAGQEGPIVTQIRSLLMPEPLRELRVKNPYKEYKVVEGAQGVKIAAKELDKAIAGLPVLVANSPDEIEILKEEVDNALKETIKSFKPKTIGVCVQASTLGSLEALLEFLTSSKIQYSNVKVGPVTKKDVMKASAMLQHDPQYALIMAFDVKVERDAEELAEEYGVKIFTANIIYHLFDKFTAYQEELLQKKRDEYKHIAVFPCKLRILPQFIFNTRDPIVVGVSIEGGVIKEGTPLCVPSKDNLEIGRITTIEVNHKPIEIARKGQEVCIKIEPIPGETPKLYGRHFDHTDLLVSKISRESIEACKSYFRNDLTKSDWQLIIELKKVFNIM